MTDDTTHDRVELEHDRSNERIDVIVDGDHFTTYQYASDDPVLSKPILQPIVSEDGGIVTRGYPLAPRPGERVDHRHHTGHFFTYGVDPGIAGVNFWGVYDEIEPDEEQTKGRIVLDEIETVGGGDDGELVVRHTWERGDGTAILLERTAFRFGSTDTGRYIDRQTTLSAADDVVPMPDDKEGMLGLRVARSLELPATEADLPPTEVVGQDGKPTTATGDVAIDPTGDYLSATGETGLDVWGTRAKWMRLDGTVDGDAVAVTIMDHPENPGFPTYWHARGYGLFAANPLGQAVFTDGAERMDFAIEPGEPATFRYRIDIDSAVPDANALDQRHRMWANES